MNIFDKKGQLDLAGLDKEIAALDPARRLALDKLIAAAEHSSAAEAALKNEESTVKIAMTTQAEAAREVERVTPKRGHHDLYLAHVKKILPAPPSDEQLAAEAALDAATEALAISRDALEAGRLAVKNCRADFASALTAWQGGPVPTQNELVRQMAKAFKPTPVPQRRAASLLDEIAEASAAPIDARQRGQHFRRGAGGQRSYPQGMRGQTVPGFVKG